MFRIIVVGLLGLFLLGCSSKPKEIVIVEQVYIPVELPKEFTKRCVATEPIDQLKYSAFDKDERIVYLSKYVINLLGDVKKCDNKLDGIVKYVGRHNDIYLNK